jgi:uncharacterized protein (DUF1501 family)
LTSTRALSRRTVLAAAAASATTTVFGDAVRQTAWAGTSNGNVLVVLSLRGGIDGLGVVVPHGDPGYAASRPTIAVPTGGLFARDALFGLHPALGALEPMWRAKKLAAVHAVGLPVPNRSHFSAMEEIEDADPGSRRRQGWVNRMAGLGETAAGPLGAVHLGSATAPTLVSGTGPALSAVGLDRISLTGAPEQNTRARTRRRTSLHTLWDDADGPLATGARAALAVTTRLDESLTNGGVPAGGAEYPDTHPGAGLGAALADTARLIRADVGVEVVSIDFGSFDLHADYGTVQGSGLMYPLVEALGRGIAAFFADLGGAADRVTLLTISEFGRRVAENGNAGLDHGWGNMMLLAGAGVRGGRYHGSWPGLGPAEPAGEDLRVTTDYRDVLGEVIARRFPTRDLSKVFPHHRVHGIGVMTSGT